MFKSLKTWMDIPFERKVFVKNNATGNKIYAEQTVKGVCYPVGEVEQITDYRGATVVSNSKLYIDGNIELDIQDAIILNGKEHNIRLINFFYRKGKVDVKVVFL